MRVSLLYPQRLESKIVNNKLTCPSFSDSCPLTDAGDCGCECGEDLPSAEDAGEGGADEAGDPFAISGS